MSLRKASYELLDSRSSFRSKFPLLFNLFLALLLFIYAESIIPYYLQSSPEVAGNLRSAGLPVVALKSVQDHVEEVSHGIGSEQHQSSPIPPLNITEEKRIAWFRRKLPELEIFRSDNLTERFHSRVLEFFDQGCEVQFFMTWISPAESFGNREMLAVASVFKSHPQGCLMILSRTLDSAQGYRLFKPLLDLKLKVLAVAPDLKFLFENTPAESWFAMMKRGKRDPGEIPLAQNLSNLVRLAVLYKYGGVYLDTDFIVLKSFKGLKNTIGAQSIDFISKNWTRLNNAVLVFDMNHPLLLKFIEEFASTFDGNRWGHNGPYLVSRVVERVEGRPGYEFTILPPMAFYPVHWTKMERLFKTPVNRLDLRWVKAKLLQLSGETYGIHLWNKQSHRLRVEKGSVIATLILEHCVISHNFTVLKRQKLSPLKIKEASST